MYVKVTKHGQKENIQYQYEFYKLNGRMRWKKNNMMHIRNKKPALQCKEPTTTKFFFFSKIRELVWKMLEMFVILPTSDTRQSNTGGGRRTDGKGEAAKGGGGGVLLITPSYNYTSLLCKADCEKHFLRVPIFAILGQFWNIANPTKKIICS